MTVGSSESVVGVLLPLEPDLEDRAVLRTIPPTVVEACGRDRRVAEGLLCGIASVLGFGGERCQNALRPARSPGTSVRIRSTDFPTWRCAFHQDYTTTFCFRSRGNPKNASTLPGHRRTETRIGGALVLGPTLAIWMHPNGGEKWTDFLPRPAVPVAGLIHPCRNIQVDDELAARQARFDDVARDAASSGLLAVADTEHVLRRARPRQLEAIGGTSADGVPHGARALREMRRVAR